MKPHGGFLIAAMLVLAIATGCRRDHRPGPAAHGGAPRRAPHPPADIAAVRRPHPAHRTITTPPASRPGRGQARDELNDLARSAQRLRHALLHADFRGANTRPDAAPAPRVDRKTAEGENDLSLNPRSAAELAPRASSRGDDDYDAARAMRKTR